MKSTEAEKEAERILIEQGYLTDRAVKATVKRGPRFIALSNDRFGLFDVVGVHPVEGYWNVQVTTGGSGDVSRRRNAIEEKAMHFPANTRLSVFEYAQRRDDIDRRKMLRFFRVHDYLPSLKCWRATQVLPLVEKVMQPAGASAPDA